ncbi:ZIP family metal transporter [Reichenbachiella agarivorans]|uniref:ZIP family metal transporter n=1 Tax=Reichenbachiella agarivorans TaxID=2979464 RepID=A0ABY6CRP2_9BACT|nr:ZIP family metal transporter [Reichenbachiella agarivorans]UXP33192.1 ZIP family metal transporter [Reichenbachiella agarivorans]
MIKSAIILFLSAFLGGILAINSVDVISKNIKHVLVFAGSFLFSVTIIHILPEIFEASHDHLKVGGFILLGFFFQQVLEYFTNGVEHGHMHHHHHGEGHTTLKSISLMVALSVHGFLEGTLLAHPESVHANHTEGTLLAGIVFHKVPAALALISVLACQYKSRSTQLILLTIFALASPAGVFAGHLLGDFGLLDNAGMVLLFAFVSGNFLHISTTIFLESSPGHSWSSRKLIISLVGATLAVLSEILF